MWRERASDLVKEGDVQREAEAVAQVDLVGQSVAELAGRGGRVGQQRFGGSVHEGYRQHDGLLGFGGLRDKHWLLYAERLQILIQSAYFHWFCLVFRVTDRFFCLLQRLSSNFSSIFTQSGCLKRFSDIYLN